MAAARWPLAQSPSSRERPRMVSANSRGAALHDMIRRTTTLLITLAALLACAVPAGAGAATGQKTSANWAGYSVSRPNVRFHSVTGTWVQPAASCRPGGRKYSAYWVGLGGVH